MHGIMSLIWCFDLHKIIVCTLFRAHFEAYDGMNILHDALSVNVLMTSVKRNESLGTELYIQNFSLYSYLFVVSVPYP